MSDRSDDIVAELLKKNPKIAAVVKDARLFDTLRTNPAWMRLFERVTAKRGRWMDDIAKRFMGPEKFWPQPTEIAYYQGYYEGAMFVLSHPEHAEANLERAARIAWALSQDIEQEEDLA